MRNRASRFRLEHENVDNAIKAVKKCDLMIIAGTSLTVYPAATFAQFLKHDRIVIINKSSTYMDLKALLTIHDNVGEVLDKVVPKRVSRKNTSSKTGAKKTTVKKTTVKKTTTKTAAKTAAKTTSKAASKTTAKAAPKKETTKKPSAKKPAASKAKKDESKS